MAYYSTAGMTLSVSPTPPPDADRIAKNLTAWEGVTDWVEVGELTELPQYGAEASMGTHSPIGKRYVQKYKGSINPGTQTLTYAIDDNDAGQRMLDDFSEGENMDNDIAVRISHPDPAVGTRYYSAKVGSSTENPGDVNSYLTGQAMLDITSPVTKSAAGTGE